MQVGHRLARLWTHVVHRPVTLFDLVFPPEFGCDQLTIAENFSILRGRFFQPDDVLARNDQEMHRSLWIDVLKNEDFLVLVDFFRGDLAGNNFAKKTVLHGWTS